MATGSCDACNAQNVRIHRADTCGIETYACAKCCGDPPRRCETNECDPGGECMSCGAISGEVCQDYDRAPTDPHHGGKIWNSTSTRSVGEKPVA